ncbi:MAG TPA: transglutaminase-like domain-containing protein [Gemmatimonadales bacterium]|nr:transglutaminase-like domain-containing protein [Gemmatimonadales bacterium]
MSRGFLAAVILVAWVASLAWLAERRFVSPNGRFTATTQHVPPGNAYYKVSWGTRQVGLASITVDTLAPTDSTPAQVRLSERLVIILAGAHGPERHEFSSNMLLTTRLGLRRADIQLDGPHGSATARIATDGDSLLTGLVRTAGGPWPSAQRIDGALLPIGALPIELAYREHPELGATVNHPVFDPATLEYYATGATITGDSTFIIPDSVVKTATGYRVVLTDTVRAWRVARVERGVPTHAWYDLNGFPVRSWTGGGLAFERTAFEFANDGLKALSDSSHPPVDLPALPPTAGPGDGALAAGTGRVRMVLRGAEFSDLQGAGPMQSFSGDTMTLDRMSHSPLRDPMRPLQPIPMTDLRFLATLRGEPRLSPDDTSVTALARSIVGSETSPRTAALRLTEWIHHNIAFAGDSAGGAWPTAAQVLSRRQGNAAGMAILFTALARRVGLPARPVAGLLVGGRQLKRHTWVEAFIGDWVPIDPAFGEFPATPAHARLLVGATSQWVEYLPLVGALQPTTFLDGE